MASWRDTTSLVAQDDLDGLLGVVLPFAEQTLNRYGELYPFGAAVSAEGEAALNAADLGLGEHPASDAVLAALYDGARSRAAEQRAVAFVADVRVSGSDAVRVELEHSEGVALVVLLPYTRSRFKKTLTFGQMSVSRGDPKVWTSS